MSAGIPGVFDVAVIGSGFGGMSAALNLVDRGARVVLLEALKYPGGCASTFARGGWRFEAGATLFSGFAPGQLMRHWIDRYALDVRVDLLDEPIELRTPEFRLRVPGNRATWVERLCALPGAPQEPIRAFCGEQAQIADALWGLFDDPELLPPLSMTALFRHARQIPSYLPLLRHVGRSFADALARHGLDQFAPMRQVFDALAQITVQVPAGEAEAPFALAATDYPFHGAAHIHGGIGRFADALVGAIQRGGGQIEFACRVSGAVQEGDGVWRIESRGGTFRARHVVANLLPQGMMALGVPPVKLLKRVERDVEGGFGSVMLYLGVARDAELRSEPHHLQMIGNPELPLVEGNHLFASVSGLDETDRGPDGARTVTVSTHLPMRAFRALTSDQQGARVAEIQQRMRATLTAHAPEIMSSIVHELPASPRTWQRFTRRADGFVGGVPRRVGLRNYLDLWPQPVVRGFWRVGDSGFPGQSTLAVAVGGHRVAAAIAKALS